MRFLDELRAQRAGASGTDRSEAVVRDWLMARPEALFDELREHAPTLVVGRMALVTRFSDVREVLARHDVFSVRPYADAITRINRGPNFLLGMDDGPEYRQQVDVLRQAFPHEDAERIRDVLTSSTAAALAPALPEGRIDLTDGFGRLVPALVIADYFGVPGPDPTTLMRWARAIFMDGFVNVLRLPLYSRRAMRESGTFRTYLDGLIARRKARRAPEAHDDVLGRLIAQQSADAPALSDEQMRDILLWCVSGMIDNVSTAVCSVIDHLLDRPDLMADAAEAARSGRRDAVQAYAIEALRFGTATPAVTRLAVREHTLSKGTPYERTIPSGTLTFAGLGAAMMDGTAITSPEEFRLDRPSDQYLHFGSGLHECLGRHLAHAHLTEMVGSILTLRGLRRRRGVTGKLRRVGAFPRRFVVEFEPSRRRA